MGAIRRHFFVAFLTITMLGTSAVAWSLFAPLEGAIVSAGTIVVENNWRKVQHPTGGVVHTLRVKEGQRVTAGEIVVSLDDTTARAALGIVTNELDALSVRMGRLRAEHSGRVVFAIPTSLQERRASEPKFARIIESEQALFASRLALRAGRRSQMSERVLQLHMEIKGLEDQATSLKRQLEVLEREFADLDDLRAKGLAPRPRVSGLQREIYQKQGAAGEMAARIAQAHGRIAETKLQILGLDRETATQVAKEMRDVEARMAELREREHAAKDQMHRLRMRAPITGIVHQLAIHTVGGVVVPGEPVMMIVPVRDELMVQARIKPSDIDQVSVGQDVRLRLSAFNQSATPEAHGKVVRIGADLTKDAQTGESYFTAGIRVGLQDLAALPNGTKLVPGMPVEAFLKTGERTLASYLLKPLLDQVQRSMRE